MLYRLALSAAQRFPQLSRPLFGTDASMPNVIKGYAALRHNRRVAPATGGGRHQSAVAEIDREGFALLGRPYDPALIDAIRARFEALTGDARAWKFRYESSGDIHTESGNPTAAQADGQRMVQRDLADPAAQIPQVLDLIDGDTAGLLEACYRTRFRLVRTSFWRNYHVPPAVSEQAEVGYSHYWHHDAHALDTLKLFVVMTDVGEDDGPFHVVGKPESRRLVRGAFDRKQARHGEGALQSIQPFKMIGPVGTTALCNTTLCLHRAGIPAPGRHRDMLQFVFVSSATPYRR